MNHIFNTRWVLEKGEWPQNQNCPKTNAQLILWSIWMF